MADLTLSAFYFAVSIVGDGIDPEPLARDRGAAAFFREVSGLEAMRETIELTEGSENRFVHKLPGKLTHPNLVLKRSFTQSDSAFVDWVSNTLQGDLTQPIKTKSLTVTLLDQSDNPLITWEVDNAFPVKWEVDSFSSKEGELVIQSIEFAYDGLERKVAAPLK